MEFDSGTLRRLVVMALGLTSVVFGRKLELDDSQLQMVVALISVYIAGSNAKEIMVKRAKAAGDAAAAGVTDENAVSIVKDAASKGGDQ